MEEMKLSKKGNDLIKLYEEMATNGIDRVDGTKKEKAYNDFQLRKFRHICKHQISNEKIKTVLDYGGGGSDWDAPGFDTGTKQSAKQFSSDHTNPSNTLAFFAQLQLCLQSTSSRVLVKSRTV